MDNAFLLGLILGIIAYLQMVFALSGVPIRQPLFSGVITGLVMGDLQTGLELGATTQLLSLGLFSFGGAAIPDLNVGAMCGVVFAVKANDVDAGLALAVPIALLTTNLDVLGRTATTIFFHGAENALNVKKNVASFERWHLAGTIPWGLSRGLPVFLAVWLGADVVSGMVEAFPDAVMNAIRLIGAVLPAIGFALLLSYMDVKKYWAYLLLGFVAFAYAGIPTLGLALMGAALGYIAVFKKGGAANA